MVTISVDDQFNVAKEISEMMYKIDPNGEHVPFSSVEEALEYAKDENPDVAWLDIEMPGMSGLELSMEIKKASPLTNIIFVTGHEKFAYQSFQLHASGFILKPATMEALQRELDNLRNPVELKKTGLLRVQCFGNFEVFDKDDHPPTNLLVNHQPAPQQLNRLQYLIHQSMVTITNLYQQQNQLYQQLPHRLL